MSQFSRRRFMQQSSAAATALAFPLVGGAQPKAVKNTQITFRMDMTPTLSAFTMASDCGSVAT